MTAKAYLFPQNLADTNYLLFPPELENDEFVLFHATPFRNLASILEDGFKIPGPESESRLRSVSFAKKSVTALTFAMNPQTREVGDYVVIAVRYLSLSRTGIVNNYSDIYDYTLEPPPQIIGFCIIPESYAHV